MSQFQPADEAYEARTRAGFQRQQIMQTIGAALTGIEPGRISITLPFRDDLTQHTGFLHAGIVTTIVDSACGFAAYTLMPPDAEVLTVEYKVNFMAPAQGDYMLATGQVVRAGRTLTVCRGDVVAVRGDAKTHIATMQATMIARLE